jgi:hypothetical protein
MFTKRWYDKHLTLALAVALLENATETHRHETIEHLDSVLKSRYAELYGQMKQEPTSFWSLNFNNRRRSMDQDSWFRIEMIRYIPDEDKDTIGDVISRYLYDLEARDTVEEFSLTGT